MKVADPDHLLYERYRGPCNRSRKLEAYYALKPLMPRRLQLALRRAYAPRQARAPFPSWPCEPALVQRRDATLLDAVRAAGGAPQAFVNWWPQRKRFATILTHDVEGPAGVANVLRVIELERRYGFVSSWNFVAEWYPIPAGLFDEIRAAGCEIGLHGILHDGKLFSDRATFDANLPKIAHYARAWDVAGFRSPATGRNAAWMHELPVDYDSSFPDSDPFEPQPGGCCSIMPFFFGDVVELPITLTQDHTVFEILRSPGIELWRRKTRWLRAHHGLVNLIVHPDYVVAQRELDRYEAFLAHLAEHDDSWHALPRDVARWWRQRERLRAGAGGAIAGSTDFAASVAYATERDGRLVVEL
jgi:hypothetical protein